MNDHNEQIANQPSKMKLQAIKALAIAKELEAEQMAAGATYQQGQNRSRILIKK
ncbi:hypothetical protein [Maribacter sp. ACAM166]|uniref:hypothetical protein n=1 Tax=Maribacter sp. ACAM166 TaxID=2508996 RepID=UPI001485C1D5|nr:hypothetical protein [Maribacter sp. ACAM166]